MPIKVDEKNRVFYLTTPNTSYIMAGIADGTIIRHIHWGRRIDDIENIGYYATVRTVGYAVRDYGFDNNISSECLPLEFGADGGCDLKYAAYSAECGGYAMLLSPKYKGYRIIDGKPDIKGLPHTYVEVDDEAQTLELTIEDVSGIRVKLYYCVYSNIDAICRWAVIENISDKSFKLKRALSASVDFEENDFELLHLDGSWARERHIQRSPIMNGTQTVGSLRGASGHLENPFIALVRPDTNENNGECYGLNLVYSGSFIAGCDTSSNTGITRAFIGINPNRFEWTLAPNEEFVTPEAVMVYSDNGIEKMSQTYHELYRTRLCRGKFRDAERPVLINNWEGTYFDFNEDKIVEIAKSAKEMGVELMVLDDGWFGKRDDDTTSLGDWFEDRKKLPNGVDGLADKITVLGMKFGLWFEPEMVSPDSELFRKHPDWHIHVPGRQASTGRQQYTLDLTNPEIQDYIIEAVGSVLRKAKISYVKWDMNRIFGELGSSTLPAERNGELSHRYMLGLYRILETLVSEFPDVLFEGCAGGGGRFDAGLLYYMPQIWTSDCSEAVERLKIQYGTSVVYPSCTMGAHVSAVPNHQVGRTVSLKMRGDVAMLGQFGYELDSAKLSVDERNEVKEQIKFYKSIREVIHKGTMYRLRSPFEGQVTAFDYVSPDKSKVVLFTANVLGEANSKIQYIKLRGLDKDAVYKETESGNCYSGSVLMNLGIKEKYESDFNSRILVFEKVR